MRPDTEAVREGKEEVDAKLVGQLPVFKEAEQADRNVCRRSRLLESKAAAGAEGADGAAHGL